MNQWLVLFNKEMTEMWRSRKWIWVPLVFVLLGISQPVTTYYLPDLLQAAGSLPEGAVIEIPMPTGAEVLAQTLSQFGMIGVLVLVLSIMGIVSSERQSGAAGLVLVKPVSFVSYITAKWAGAVTLTAVSFLAGFAASWYYTRILIGSVAPSLFAGSLLLFGLWLVFVVTVAVMLSAWMNGNSGVAFLTIGSVLLLSVLTGLFNRAMNWSPGSLSGRATLVLADGGPGTQLPLALAVTLAAIAALLFAAVRLFRRKELLP
ncbi:ABC transporter permease [Paenibacillus oceani]|uniref:ABC transporter permease n=1 Tax=Paenibacillus oceani TaxID=2772510 RepID=A0A927CAA8_9BACL|nr:ABC transporter permease subunit [Paenibacillus oceani]MBD2864344.1 ABC transporter permease [Paenibacillus oceani]